MRKFANKHSTIIIIILFILSVGVSHYFYPKDFFKLNLHNLSTIFVASFFAFHLTQKNNKKQKTKDKAEKLLIKYQSIVNEKVFVDVRTKEDVQELFMMHRRLSNIITVLNQMNLDVSLTRLQEKAEEHKQLLSDHMNDIDYLKKSGKEFRRIIEGVDFTIDDIVVKLFL